MASQQMSPLTQEEAMWFAQRDPDTFFAWFERGHWFVRDLRTSVRPDAEYLIGTDGMNIWVSEKEFREFLDGLPPDQLVPNDGFSDEEMALAEEVING